MPENRKLVAIIAVVVVGFSSLTGGDEDARLLGRARCGAI